MGRADTSVWTVRGVAREIRDAALRAAKAERRTLGDWLERVLRHELGLVKTDPGEPPQRDRVEELARRLTTVEGRLAALEATPAKPDRHRTRSGAKGGRPPVVTADLIASATALAEQGLRTEIIAHRLEVSEGSIRRALRQAKAREASPPAESTESVPGP